jgi:hypothetical protein
MGFGWTLEGLGDQAIHEKTEDNDSSKPQVPQSQDFPFPIPYLCSQSVVALGELLF